MQGSAVGYVDVVAKPVDAVTERGQTASGRRRLAAKQCLIRKSSGQPFCNNGICLDEKLFHDFIARARFEDVVRVGDILVVGLVQQSQRRNLDAADAITAFTRFLRYVL